jgi:hypothetical protein
MLTYVQIHVIRSYAPNEIYRSEMSTAFMQHCQLKETLLPSTDTSNGFQNCIKIFHSSIKQSINMEAFVGRDAVQSCAEVPTFRRNHKPILRTEAAGSSKGMVYGYQTIRRPLLIFTTGS